ncbi:MAG: hotdog domain-containing protein [Romboutsia sp.]
MKCTTRIRMGLNDAHYARNIINGSKIIQLFEDIAKELLIRNDGDEGLFKAYTNIEFISPVYAGDYIEVTGEIIRFGSTSREIKFEAKKVATQRVDICESAADYLLEPKIVCKAIGTCVVLKEKQRF